MCGEFDIKNSLLNERCFYPPASVTLFWRTSAAHPVPWDNPPPMLNILILGCGDVARRALPWLTQRARVFALVREPRAQAALRAQGVHVVLGDLDDLSSLRRLRGLAQHVLYCAPPATGGAAHDDARLRHALAALGASPRTFIYISTTGVYGDCQGDWVQETRRTNPTSDRARRRVAAEALIRRAAKHITKRNAMRSAILRAPGIYAADRLPLARLQQGLPTLCAEDDVFSNHIHADDLARVLALGLFRAKAGARAYNVSDNSQLKMSDYFDAVADAFSLPRPPRERRAECAQQLSPMTLSFMNESRRLSSARLQTEWRVRLKYPQVSDALKQISPKSLNVNF